MGLAGETLGGAGKGAAIGALGGPIGIGAGAAIGGGAALIGGLLSRRGKNKEKEEKARLFEEFVAQQEAQFGDLQDRRSTRLNLVQGSLGAIQPTLQEGAPNYQFDPEELAKFQEGVAFGGVDPRGPGVTTNAGGGSQLLGGLLGDVGDVATNYSQGALLGETDQTSAARDALSADAGAVAPELAPGNPFGAPQQNVGVDLSFLDELG